MTTATHHLLVALNLPTHVPDIIKQGRAIVVAMTANTSFPSSNPALAAVTTALDELDTAETAALTKAKGTAEARDAALAKVKRLLRQLEAYVQLIADGSGEQAEPVIVSAAMNVRKVTPRQKQVFEAVQSVSGSTSPGKATNPPGTSTNPRATLANPRGAPTNPARTARSRARIPTNPQGKSKSPAEAATNPRRKSTGSPETSIGPPGISRFPRERSTSPPNRSKSPAGTSTHRPDDSTNPPGSSKLAQGTS